MEGNINVEIRSLTCADIDDIVAIDKKVTGEAKPDYWHRKLEAYLGNPDTCIAAVLDGKVVGFILGHVKGGEFGSSDGTGWIELMGVDPQYKQQGIGTLLYECIEQYFRQVGVTKVYTLVTWNDRTGILLHYFDNLGFKRADFIALEKDIK